MDPNPWNHYGPHPLLHILQQLNISLNSHLRLPPLPLQEQKALSEAETVEVAQVGRDDTEFEEHPVTIIPGWAALQQEIIQGIVDSIHANPLFYDHLIAQFPGQEEIFRTSVAAWRGLHIVCRRLEAREVARLADAEDPDSWEEYIRTGGNPPPHPDNRLLHTPPQSTDSLPDSIHTNITYQNDEDGRLITNTYIVSAEDIEDEHYVAYD